MWTADRQRGDASLSVLGGVRWQYSYSLCCIDGGFIGMGIAMLLCTHFINIASYMMQNVNC